MPIAVLLQEAPWSAATTRALDLAVGAEQGLVALGIALAIVLLGWVLAMLVSAVTKLVLRALHFDAGVRRVLGGRMLGRHEPANVVAWALRWTVLAGCTLLALESIGFHLSAPVADRLTEVLPRIVTAAVLFTMGSLVALLAGSITRRFLETADVRLARLQGQVVSVTLTGFSALLALEQLGFAAQFVMAIGVAAVASAGLGLALAFGLGCRDLARDFVVEYLRSLEEPGPKRPE